MQEGFTTVIAAGGDGTVNEVVCGMADAPGGCDQARLGVLPLGTVNVFAKELGIPSSLSRALEIATSGPTRRIDLPCVDFSGTSGPEVRWFAQLAGAGLDARAIERVEWRLKKRYGAAAYLLAGISALRHPLPPLKAVSEEGRSAEGELVLLGNGRYYGGRFTAFPGGRLDDGRLQVAVFPKARLLTLVRVLAGIATSRLHRFSGATVWQARELTVSCPVPMPFELDGDNVGHLPARFRIDPRRLSVAAPMGEA